jgi:hypothetical protein
MSCFLLQLLRVIDALQLAAKYPVATPADWQPGDEVMITPKVSNEEANKLFPKGYRTIQVKSGKVRLQGGCRWRHGELCCQSCCVAAILQCTA